MLFVIHEFQGERSTFLPMEMSKDGHLLDNLISQVPQHMIPRASVVPRKPIPYLRKFCLFVNSVYVVICMS